MTGACLCGEVTVRVDGGHERAAGACHCRSCQRWSGGLLLCFEAAPGAVTAEGPVRRHASSTFAERAFCGTCGSHLWIRDTDLADAPYDLMPGLFDAASGWPLRSEVYADRAMTSLRLSGDHPRRTAADYEATNSHVDGDAS